MKKLLLLITLTFSLTTIFCQEKSITGRVTDKSGQPVAGATVQVKSSGKSVVADADGNGQRNSPLDLLRPPGRLRGHDVERLVGEGDDPELQEGDSKRPEAEREERPARDRDDMP